MAPLLAKAKSMLNWGLVVKGHHLIKSTAKFIADPASDFKTVAGLARLRAN